MMIVDSSFCVAKGVLSRWRLLDLIAQYLELWFLNFQIEICIKFDRCGVVFLLP